MNATIDCRLKLIATMIRKDVKVADIGTDHALLPIYLVENSISRSVIASDLREGPLCTARQNITLANLNNAITIRLSDGLKNFSENEVDDIVIAGMGGILITKIIEDALWIKSPDKHLILQPMSDCNIVREYLLRNGFNIIKEKAAVVKNHIYSVMQVCYTGDICECTQLTSRIGKLYEGDKLEIKYMKREVSRLRKIADELKFSNQIDSEKRIEETISVALEIEKIIFEMEKRTQNA